MVNAGQFGQTFEFFFLLNETMGRAVSMQPLRNQRVCCLSFMPKINNQPTKKFLSLVVK